MNMQELKTTSADNASRESNKQIQSHRMEVYHTNQEYTELETEKELIKKLVFKLLKKWKN